MNSTTNTPTTRIVITEIVPILPPRLVVRELLPMIMKPKKKLPLPTISPKPIHLDLSWDNEEINTFTMLEPDDIELLDGLLEIPDLPEIYDLVETTIPDFEPLMICPIKRKRDDTDYWDDLLQPPSKSPRTVY